MALEYASDELKADREIVLAAVQKDGWALEFATKEFRADREFVMAAFKKNIGSIEYASKEIRKELRADPEIIRKVALADLLSDLFEPLPELKESNLRKNVPKEFQALRKRWNEFLENLITFKLEGGVVETGSYSMASAAAIFEKACWCWRPRLEKSQYDEVDRLGQHFKGPMYTCEKYPWPVDDEGCAYPPVVQIDLDKASTLAGVFLGDGFLQLFYDGELDHDGTSDLCFTRQIPRASISVELMTPVPEDFDEFQTFKLVKETYFHCTVITGFEKGIFEINTIDLYDLPFSSSESVDSSDLEDEVDKLSNDLDKFRDSTTSEESADEYRARAVGFSSLFGVPGGSSQLFGVYEPQQEIAHQQGDPFLSVDLNDFGVYGGVIYFDGPNDFSWYWNR